MFADLRAWPAQRILIAAAVAGVLLAGLAATSGIVTITVATGALAFPAPWWAYAATALGAVLVGLIGASYVAAPIGAEATLCDLRWPVLGLIGLYLATDLLTAAPLVSGLARPAVAAAAVALLVWALVERLRSEHRAVSRDGDGEVCTTCRPLFPSRATPGAAPDTAAHAAPAAAHPHPHPHTEVAP